MDDPRGKPGGVWPTTVPIGQSWYDIGALIRLCARHEIVSFVEIGLMEGGLASLMLSRVIFGESFRYLGIENEQKFLGPRFLVASAWFGNFEILDADAFEQDTVMTVSKWIRKGVGPALIYCDDGDKPKELELYKSILRDGDLIAAHDLGHEFEIEDLQTEGLKPIESRWLTDTHIAAFQNK
jgi:hypothetical protein